MNEHIPPRTAPNGALHCEARAAARPAPALTAGSAALAMTAGVLGASAPSAGAATTFTVDSLNNSGAGTLRDALGCRSRRRHDQFPARSQRHDHAHHR